MKSIKIKEGENIYTTPSPDYKYSGKYICVKCDFKGTKREVLKHKCEDKSQCVKNRQ